MLAILADIHGNRPALEAVLRRIDELGGESIISLGDVVGYYAQPNECIDILRARGICHLMGNHDQYLATGADCPRSRSANDCLRYHRKVISRDNLDWLSKSSPALVIGEMSMVHAGWDDPLEEYLVNPDENYFRGRTGTMFLSAHTHVPLVKRFEGILYANPGSVGQPRDGDPRASFGLVDGLDVTIERVTYDIDATTAAMRDAGFTDYYYRNLYSGTSIGSSNL